MGDFMFSRYCEALEQVGGREAAKILMLLAESRDGYGAAGVLVHLSEVADASVEGWLITFAGKRSDLGVQRWCCSILGRVGTPAATLFLEQQLDHRDSLVRDRAFEALSLIHAREDEIWLGTALNPAPDPADPP